MENTFFYVILLSMTKELLSIPPEILEKIQEVTGQQAPNVNSKEFDAWLDNLGTSYPSLVDEIMSTIEMSVETPIEAATKKANTQNPISKIIQKLFYKDDWGKAKLNRQAILAFAFLITSVVIASGYLVSNQSYAKQKRERNEARLAAQATNTPAELPVIEVEVDRAEDITKVDAVITEEQTPIIQVTEATVKTKQNTDAEEVPVPNKLIYERESNPDESMLIVNQDIPPPTLQKQNTLVTPPPSPLNTPLPPSTASSNYQVLNERPEDIVVEHQRGISTFQRDNGNEYATFGDGSGLSPFKRPISATSPQSALVVNSQMRELAPMAAYINDSPSESAALTAYTSPERGTAQAALTAYTNPDSGTGQTALTAYTNPERNNGLATLTAYKNNSNSGQAALTAYNSPEREQATLTAFQNNNSSSLQPLTAYQNNNNGQAALTAYNSGRSNQTASLTAYNNPDNNSELATLTSYRNDSGQGTLTSYTENSNNTALRTSANLFKRTTEQSSISTYASSNSGNTSASVMFNRNGDTSGMTVMNTESENSSNNTSGSSEVLFRRSGSNTPIIETIDNAKTAGGRDILFSRSNPHKADEDTIEITKLNSSVDDAAERLSIPTLKTGQIYIAELVTNAVALQGSNSSRSLVVAESKDWCEDKSKECPVVRWIGEAKYNNGRIDIEFTSIMVASKTVGGMGIAFANDNSQGLSATVSDTSPTLASDLIRSAASGVSDYANALATASTVTTNGQILVEQSATPDFWSFLMGSAASTLSIPNNTTTLVRSAQTSSGETFQILYQNTGNGYNNAAFR